MGKNTKKHPVFETKHSDRAAQKIRKSQSLAASALPFLCYLLLLFCSSCDWLYYAFMNSIPFHGDPKYNPDVYVYLGVDGLSYFTAQNALERGAFTGSDWKLAKFVTGFPGTSDASWTRLLHTQEMGGYEIGYYDPIKDTLVNQGLLGLAEHITPAISKTINFQPDYYRAFDWTANGYLHGMEAYTDTFVSFANTVDNIFQTLEGRAETGSVFSAYILEMDVMGHTKSSQDTTQSLLTLYKKIEEFQRNHPERNFHFTLFSDHGLDFIPVKPEGLVRLDEELPKVGVKAVTNLKSHDPNTELFAIPILHTQVTYVALHTLPELAEKVAEKTSLIPAVELAVARLQNPPEGAPLSSDGTEWFGIWKEGNLLIPFGFDRRNDHYWIRADADFRAVDLEGIENLTANETAGDPWKRLSDEELFKLTQDQKYPDLFYRVRTSLSAVGCLYPAQVMTTYRPGFASLGFQLLGSDQGTPTSGFHGSLEYRGTLGTLLTNERTIPAAVRSDTLLDLFPKLQEHIHSRGVATRQGDAHSSLEY